jgi:hypothetical protein
MWRLEGLGDSVVSSLAYVMSPFLSIWKLVLYISLASALVYSYLVQIHVPAFISSIYISTLTFQMLMPIT